MKMGGSCSSTILTEDELNDYTQLTYLTKSEILHIFDRFRQLGHETDTNRRHRYPTFKVMEIFTELKYNPFKDRISYVFSSEKDDSFSFEDILDLANAFSENCPVEVRAKWAFLIFDFDNDQQISKDDIMELLTRLTETTKPIRHSISSGETLNEFEKEKIADLMLQTMDLDGTGGISNIEFIHALSKMPEFAHTFRIKL